MTVDVSHSEIGFKVKHLMISTVKGGFNNFDVQVNGDMDNLSVECTIDTASITTNNEDRDNHLRSADFFDCENYPKIQFISENFSVNNGEINGELTIKGVSQPIIMTCEYNGVSVDPWDNKKHGFELTGKVNRSDFGLTWNSTLETGGVLVSDEVKLEIDVQLLEQ